MKSPTLLQKVSLGVMLAIVGLSVLLLLPITDNFILISKAFWLFFSAILVTALFMIHSLQRRALEFILTPFNWLLLLFGLAVLASTFFTNAYPVEGLLGMGGAYLSFVVIALLGGTLLSRLSGDRFLTGLGIIGVLLTVTSLLQLTNFGPSAWLNQLFGLQLPVRDLVFNLTGSTLIAAEVLAITILGFAAQIFSRRHVSKPTAVMLPILIIGLLLHIWSMLPGQSAALQLPSFASSWSVALDTIRQPRSALIGAGPGSYGNVYNQFKPLWVNGTDTWNIQFIQGANVPLTILTTLGFLGLILWALLALVLLRQVRAASPEGKALAWMIAGSLLINLLFPPNIVLLTLQAALLAVFAATEKGRFSLAQVHALSLSVVSPSTKYPYGAPVTHKPTKPLYFGLGLAALLLVFLTYLTGRAYAAHFYMNEAAKAAVRDDGVAVHDLQAKAVELNPYLDQLRREYAATNMLIALALSNKTDATQQEQELVGQLVQRAIAEARSATALDPGDSQNWLILAQIYQNIIGSVEQADQYAVQSYVSAIETNPTDPGLRINLGGIFLGQQNYQQAATFFQQATQLKPDYANAYYNLAVALKNLQQFEASRDAYRQVLALVEENSPDRAAVTRELEEVERLLTQQQAQQGENGQGQGGASGTPSPAPSLIDQTIQQSEQDLVNQPATGELDLPEGETAPAPTARPAATVQPTQQPQP